jgi:hypothetical protein
MSQRDAKPEASAGGSSHPTGIGRLTALGLAVVALSIVLLRVLPSRMGDLPPGMITPVLAVELARSPAEMERIFGDQGSTERQEWRVRMVRGTWIDFGLLTAYGTFLAAVAGQIGRRSRSTATRLAFAAALGAAIFDAVENRQILVICSRLGGEYGDSMPRLVFATWGKWLLLALWFVLLSRPLWNARGFFRAAAIAGTVGAGGALVAVILRGVAAEIMLNGISVGLAMLVVGAYREQARQRRGGGRADWTEWM